MLRKFGLSRFLLFQLIGFNFGLITFGVILIAMTSRLLSGSMESGSAAVSRLGLSHDLLAAVTENHVIFSGLINEKDPDVLEKKIEQLKSGDSKGLELLSSCGRDCSAGQKIYVEYQTIRAAIQDAFLHGRGAETSESYIQNLNPKFDALLAEISRVNETVREAVKAANQRAAEESRSQRTLLMILALVICGITLATGLYFRQVLTRVLSKLTERLVLIGAQNRESSQSISQSTDELSQRTAGAASFIQETVASVEELSATVHRNAENSKEAANLSQSGVMASRDNQENFSMLSRAIQELSSYSKKIGEITTVIDDIAFQTNLLALNAAVEAARAGEHGRGFAVVSEAVRDLAQRCGSAAGDISGLVKECVERIENGAAVAHQAESSLGGVVSSVNKGLQLNTEIAAASTEQATGISQIAKAMSELDVATQKNAVSVDALATNARAVATRITAMDALVLELKSVVHGQISKEPPAFVSETHAAF